MLDDNVTLHGLSRYLPGQPLSGEMDMGSFHVEGHGRLTGKILEFWRVSVAQLWHFQHSDCGIFFFFVVNLGGMSIL